MEISVITKFDYDQALSISDDKDFQKHYKLMLHKQLFAW